MSTKPDLRVVCVHAPPVSPLGHFVSAGKRFTDEWCEGDHKASVADLVAALIAEGGRVSYAKSAEAWRGWIVQGSEPGSGRYLVFPLPVESAEAKETPR